MTYEITSSDVTQIEPVNGAIHVRGIIKTPTQMIRISWEVVCSPGETICQAWLGQHEIDRLARAGYKILSVALHE